MLTLHLGALFLSLIIIMIADKEALQWIRGRKPTLSHARMRRLHILMWVGLVALCVSGIALFIPRWDYLIQQPMFILKLLFVGILVVNAVLVGRLMHTAEIRTCASLSWGERMPLLTSGAVSFFAWGATIVLALLVFR